jgi:hypothetical protein
MCVGEEEGKMLRFLYKMFTNASENLFAGTLFAMQIYPMNIQDGS